jgi:phosphatidylglycerophosphate synthase
MEQRRARAYPLSRWYLRPAAGRLAAVLAPTSVRPEHLTLCGLAMAGVAALVIAWRPAAMPVAALFVLAYWFFDRADGQLARRQHSVSAWGAWLDANVDELVDVGLHVAIAAAVAATATASWPWCLLIAFLAGKYLFMYGLTTEEQADEEPGPAGAGIIVPQQTGLLHRLYHLPGNADVRVHLLAAAVATGLLTTELALVAAYYNVRWIVRYGLVARRLRGSR